MAKRRTKQNAAPSRLLQRSSASHQKRWLRRLLAVFFLALVVPLAILVFVVRERLRTESFLEHRLRAEELVLRIERKLSEILAVEENRRFDEYTFINVGGSEGLGKVIEFSPLSRLPEQLSVPALLGHFQINPDGTFHSPLLPAVEETELLNEMGILKITPEEFERRLALIRRVRDTLSTNSALPGRTNRFPINEDKKEMETGDNRLSVLEGLFSTRKNVSEAYTQQLAEEHINVSAPFGRAFQQTAATQAAQQESTVAQMETDDLLAGERSKAQKGLSSGQLSKLNIDEGLWSKEGKSEKSFSSKALLEPLKKSKIPIRERRLEQVSVPALSNTADDRFNDLADALPQEASGKESDTEEARLPRLDGKIPVLTLEGEVDPFQLRILGGGEFLFLRKVWRDNQRFLQGFVVKGTDFLGDAIRSVFEGDPIGGVSRLIIAHDGNPIVQFQPRRKDSRFAGVAIGDAYARPSGQEQILLYRSFLSDPFDSLELFFTAEDLPLGAEAEMIYGLAGLVVLIMLFGTAGLYRLGTAQIALSAERSNFVSAVSHELKTPLTSIRMYAEMLRSGWVGSSDKIKSYYDFIFFESERLSRLISNILLLSRLSNNTAELELREFDPHDVLGLIEGKVRSQVEAAGFELAVEHPGEKAPLILAEEDACTCIFINLIDNALKFSAKADQKRVEIGFRVMHQVRPEVCFFVRDYGPGVERNQMKKIFRLFYRAEDEMTRTTAGTGIGLALVSELVAKMGARVGLKNRDPGAEFMIVFRIETKKDKQPERRGDAV